VVHETEKDRFFILDKRYDDNVDFPEPEGADRIINFEVIFQN
tara:strand:+ start:1331 stop:1456 length:126 start_codon:yes stop_codon:yes gene_type:complete